jgi:hypothetical protein
MRSGAHRARITLGVLGALVLGLLAWAQPAAQAAQARQAVRGSQSPQVIWARQVTRPGRVTRVIRASRMARAAQVPGDEHPMTASERQALTRPDAAEPYSYSDVVWTGSETAVAATGIDGDMSLFVQPVNTTEWIEESLPANPNGSPGDSSPSMVWTGSVLDISVIDGYGYLEMWTQNPSTGSWTTAILDLDREFQEAAITMDADGAVAIAGETIPGPGSGLYLYYQKTPGREWFREIIDDELDTSSAFGAPGIAADGDVIYVTLSNEAGVEVWDQGLGAGAWGVRVLAVGTSTVGYGHAAIAVNDYNVVAITAPAYTTPGGGTTTTAALDEWYQAYAGAGWVEQTVSSEPSGAIYSSPAIAAAGPNFFIAAGSVGSSGSNANGLDYWWGSPQTSWNPETVSGGYWAGTAVTVSNDQVLVTAGSDGGLDYPLDFWAQTYGLSTWQYEQIT